MFSSHFDIFISYKHGASKQFAAQLEKALRTYAIAPWIRPRRVFRDENYVVSGESISTLIERALERSSFLVLLASEEAADSEWVQDELQRWCDGLGRATKLIIVLTQGEIYFEKQKESIDWIRSTALPRLLRDYINGIPYIWDARSLRQEQLTLLDPIFKHEINRIVARLAAVEPASMLLEEHRVHRRTVFLKNSALSAMTLLTTATGVLTFLVWSSSRETTKQKQIAVEEKNGALAIASRAALRRGLSESDPNRRLARFAEALRLQPTNHAASTAAFHVLATNSFLLPVNTLSEAELPPSIVKLDRATQRHYSSESYDRPTVEELGWSLDGLPLTKPSQDKLSSLLARVDTQWSAGLVALNRERVLVGGGFASGGAFRRFGDGWIVSVPVDESKGSPESVAIGSEIVGDIYFLAEDLQQRRADDYGDVSPPLLLYLARYPQKRSYQFGVVGSSPVSLFAEHEPYSGGMVFGDQIYLRRSNAGSPSGDLRMPLFERWERRAVMGEETKSNTDERTVTDLLDPSMPEQPPENKGSRRRLFGDLSYEVSDYGLRLVKENSQGTLQLEAAEGAMGFEQRLCWLPDKNLLFYIAHYHPSTTGILEVQCIDCTSLTLLNRISVRIDREDFVDFAGGKFEESRGELTFPGIAKGEYPFLFLESEGAADFVSEPWSDDRLLSNELRSRLVLTPVSDRAPEFISPLLEAISGLTGTDAGFESLGMESRLALVERFREACEREAATDVLAASIWSLLYQRRSSGAVSVELADLDVSVAEEQGATRTHVVGEDDTLEAIANSLGLSPSILGNFNDLSEEALLYTGEILQLPTKRLNNDQESGDVR